MNFLLSEKQINFKKTVRAFVESEIAPFAESFDTKNKFPENLFKKMGKVGMTGVIVPLEYGGEGLGHIEKIIVLEEVSKHSAGVGLSLMTHFLGMSAVLYYGSEDQKARYLPGMAKGLKVCCMAITEASGGSDIANQSTNAKQSSNNSWVLNGSKRFITNAHIADYCVLTAKTETKERPDLSAFIVEGKNPGLSFGKEESKLGLRGSVTGDIFLDNLVLGNESLLGQKGDGMKIALTCIGEIGRAGMAAISIGIIKACIDESLKFIYQRKIDSKSLESLQSIQFTIAESRVDYEAARALTYKAAAMKDRGVPCYTDYSVAKLFATEAAVRVARNTIDVMGGYGIIGENPVGRFLRDALSCIPCCGTSQIQKIIISNSTFKSFNE